LLRHRAGQRPKSRAGASGQQDSAHGITIGELPMNAAFSHDRGLASIHQLGSITTPQTFPGGLPAIGFTTPGSSPPPTSWWRCCRTPALSALPPPPGASRRAKAPPNAFQIAFGRHSGQQPNPHKPRATAELTFLHLRNVHRRSRMFRTYRSAGRPGRG
jgi:hypothetical protein